jgi:hypothetical protein
MCSRRTSMTAFPFRLARGPRRARKLTIASRSPLLTASLERRPSSTRSGAVDSSGIVRQYPVGGSDQPSHRDARQAIARTVIGPRRHLAALPLSLVIAANRRLSVPGGQATQTGAIPLPKPNSLASGRLIKAPPEREVASSNLAGRAPNYGQQPRDQEEGIAPPLLAAHHGAHLALAVRDEVAADVDGHGVELAGESERGLVVGAYR